MSYPSFSKKLVGLAKFNLVLVNTTGLLIQMPASALTYRIGGADRYPIVIRKKYGNRELEVPYITGSSLKGRIRALLELARGEKLYTTDSKIWAYVRSLTAMKFEEFRTDVLNRNSISELFGWAAANYKQIFEKAEEFYRDKVRDEAKVREIVLKDTNELFDLLAPTRMLFSDFYPSDNFVNGNNVSSVTDFLEEKFENRIDRVTSAADPRDIVRVRPDVEFEGNIVMLLFDKDRDKVAEYFDTLLEGFALLESTYLGSSGSRGYGRVKFVGRKVIIQRARLSQGSKDVLEVIREVEFNSLEDLKAKRDEIVKHIGKLFEGSGA